MRVPTLMPCGAEDCVHRGDDVRLEMFREVSHCPQHEVTQKITRHLLRFFGGTRGQTPRATP